MKVKERRDGDDGVPLYVVMQQKQSQCLQMLDVVHLSWVSRMEEVEHDDVWHSPVQTMFPRRLMLSLIHWIQVT